MLAVADTEIDWQAYMEQVEGFLGVRELRNCVPGPLTNTHVAQLHVHLLTGGKGLHSTEGWHRPTCISRWILVCVFGSALANWVRSNSACPDSLHCHLHSDTGVNFESL